MAESALIMGDQLLKVLCDSPRLALASRHGSSFSLCVRDSVNGSVGLPLGGGGHADLAPIDTTLT